MRPLLPSSKKDPTGVASIEVKAMREYKRRISKAVGAYKQALSEIPAEPQVNRAYQFDIFPKLLRKLLDKAAIATELELLAGGESQPWLFERYVSAAAVRGTAQQFANLSRQSAAYLAGRKSLLDIAKTEPYKRRMALARARVFEEMAGLSSSVKAELGRVLMDGIGRGKAPQEIAKALEQRGLVAGSRADVIARTEVTMALKRARWDESEEANEKYGLRMKEMHLSALLPTTRPHHADRHGNLYTMDEVRDWWAEDANAINCHCTTVSVMVDANDKPIVQEIVDKAVKTKENVAKREGARQTKD